MPPTVPLAELLDLPGPFLFRVVADHHELLVDWCTSAIRTALGRPPEEVETVPSAGGRYRSVRLGMRVETAEEVTAAYAALKAVPGVRLLL